MLHDEVEDTLILEKIEEGDNPTMSDHAQDICLEGDELLLPIRCAISDPASSPDPAVRGDLRGRNRRAGSARDPGSSGWEQQRQCTGRSGSPSLER